VQRERETKRLLSALPNVGHQILHISGAGIISSSPLAGLIRLINSACFDPSWDHLPKGNLVGINFPFNSPSTLFFTVVI
jgi:hypothetical protein